MPEGDTVHRAARQLEVLRGGTITHSDIRVPRFAAQSLVGAQVCGARAVGKHLFIDLAWSTTKKLVVHSHLKMEGQWFVHSAGTRWSFPAHRVRIVLRTRHDAGTELEAVGVELGELNIFTPAQADSRVAHLGPDLLGQPPEIPGAVESWQSGRWSGAEALRRLRAHPDTAIGTALLDQRNIAGIGNEYRAEVLFLTGHHPARTVIDVDQHGGLESLLLFARRTMLANLERPARIFTGIDRKGQRHWVYGRGGQPCRRCGTQIRAATITEIGARAADDDRWGRTVFFCPHCQH